MEHHRAEQSVADYLAVLRRRKWILLLAVVAAPAVAVALSVAQPKLYEASANILLTGALTGASSPFSASAGAVQTQIEIASSPAVAARVLKSARVTDRSAGQLIAQAGFGSIGDSDVFRISVTDGDRELAVTLANVYARQYALYRNELGKSFITRSRKEIETRMAALEASGQQDSALYAALAVKTQDLLQAEALQTSSALLLRPATSAVQVQPRPTRNGVLGLAIGIVLGITLAFLLEAIDTRVRTARGVADLLGLPVLGRLTAPSRKLRRRRRLVMVDAPGSAQAEAIRMLGVNLDLQNVGGYYKLLLVTSATEGEGKSTTAANVAVALARTGRRVVLADLDLRRPSIERFFGLKGSPGLTDVARGIFRLESAIVRVPIGGPDGGAGPGASGHNGRSGQVTLEVLPSGALPASPGEFVGTPAVCSILESLRDRADIVVIDAPPLLDVSDTLSLTTVVDGILLVARIGAARPPVLRQTRDVLESTPTATVGVVITGAERERDYWYGPYGYARPHAGREPVHPAGAGRPESAPTSES